jgi:Fe2+ or Zn2+ uptake regulation protein
MIPNIPNIDKSIIRRPTTQRQLILKAICEINDCSGEHPTAREIFEIVSRLKKMSFGTVYRNLQILTEEGEIICVQTGYDAIRYDRRRDRHYHFHCKNCGKVFDIPFPYSTNIDIEATKNSNFVVEFHTVTFEGLCLQCTQSPAALPVPYAN